MIEVFQFFGSFVLIIVGIIIITHINYILLSFSKTVDILTEIKQKTKKPATYYTGKTMKINYLNNTQKILDKLCRLILLSLLLGVLYKGINQQLSQTGSLLLLLVFTALYFIYDKYHMELFS